MASKAYNFHLSLSPELHEMLRAESKASGERVTNLAREALADWLRRRKKERRHAEIAAFAAEHAGTDLDLDRDLEEAGIEACACGQGAVDRLREAVIGPYRAPAKTGS